MKILIMSDIHGNQEAFKAVVDRAAQIKNIKACILLGDMIDYGMHSNEVIQMAKSLPYPIICNICGNHENAVLMDDYSRFSSERGRNSAQYTKSILNHASWDFLHDEMKACGFYEFACDGKKCLAVHGSLADKYWKSIKPEDLLPEYMQYDYVFSGHSHLPHFVEKYYDCDDVQHRNKKKVIFINPGSVGQPRNLNNMAQFVVLDMKEELVMFEKVRYNIKLEQASYNGQVDEFYCERLEWGV